MTQEQSALEPRALGDLLNEIEYSNDGRFNRSHGGAQFRMGVDSVVRRVRAALTAVAPACDGIACGGYDRGWNDGDKGAHGIMESMKDHKRTPHEVPHVQTDMCTGCCEQYHITLGEYAASIGEGDLLREVRKQIVRSKAQLAAGDYVGLDEMKPATYDSADCDYPAGDDAKLCRTHLEIHATPATTEPVCDGEAVLAHSPRTRCTICASVKPSESEDK